MEAEVTGKLLRRRIRPYEVPISYRARTREEGKKITWRDGVRRCGSSAASGCAASPGTAETFAGGAAKIRATRQELLPFRAARPATLEESDGSWSGIGQPLRSRRSKSRLC